MNDFLQRYAIGKRLMSAFTILLVLMALIAATAFVSLQRIEARLQTIVDDRVASMRLSNRLYDEGNALYLAMQAVVLADSPQDQEAALNERNRAREAYAEAYQALQALPADEQSRRIQTRIDEVRAAAAPINNRVIELHQNGDRDAAIAALRTETAPIMAQWREAITANIDNETALMLVARQEADAAAGLARWVLGITLGVSVILGLLLSVVITRSLTGPLSRAANAARQLAQGHLDTHIPPAGGDEVGAVVRAIGQTRDAVRILRDGLQETARQHELGNISFKGDPALLQGDYRVVGQSINDLLDDHIKSAQLAGYLADRYARGDLSEDFPRVPGEKQALMNAMDNVKATIGRVSAQILQLSQAAVHGDFSVRGDETRFEYGFRDMVANLNQLMATADGSLGDLSSVLRGIAEGDLTVRMEGDYQGVFAQMRDDANTTVANLTGIVSRIQDATGHINTAASEIATGNQDLSRRTEQQAANLEETAASMEELTSTVRQNAEHARQANQLAIGAADVASSGGQVVGEVVTTMAQIQEASRRIADIISVIDGIAFQTNILALNAAVEAARAGEQGRGFAVVATEVRTLAQRSATAAKEIKALIDNSVERVDAGSVLVRKAGTTMGEIVSSVQRVTDIMAEISAASQEQTAGIEQVSQTVMQMDEATQQNAALVEEASAAARAMEDQATQLAQAVAVFRLSGGSATSPAHQAEKREVAAATTSPAVAAKPTAAKPTSATGNKAGKPAPRRAAARAVVQDNDSQWQEF